MHPAGYEPMLATASRQLEGGGWAFEPKLDGWRALLHVDEQVTVYSRPGRDLPGDLPQLAGLAGAFPAGTVIDGELVAGGGRAWSFYQLSPSLSTRRSGVTFAHIRFHDLRHSHCAHLIAAGRNPEEIIRRLGHASVSFTLDRYGHLMPDAGAQAAAAVAALVDQPHG